MNSITKTKDSIKLLSIISYIVLFFYVAFATSSFTFLRADGCSNFVSILTSKSFYTYDAARDWGLIIKQLFAVLPIKYLGLRNIKVIVMLLSFGYSFWTAFYYFLAVRLCRKNNQPVALVCTVFVFSLQIIFCGFSLITEAIFSGTVFWFLLIFILFYQEERLATSEYIAFIAFIASIILGYKLYASMFIMYFFLIFIMLLKLHMKQLKLTPKCGFALLLLVTGFILNLQYGLRTSSAKDSWFESLKLLPKSFFVIIITLMLLGFSSLFIHNKNIVCLLKKDHNVSTNRVHLQHFCSILEVLLILEIGYITIHEGITLAGANFLTRSLNLFIPLMIGTFLSFLLLAEIKLPENIYRNSAFAFAICALVSYTMATTAYSDYLKTLSNTTLNENGYLSCTTNNICGNAFYDNWSIACASIFASTLYSGNDYIKSVVVQEKEWIGWEPFDSYDIYSYPDLSDYNIYYVFESFPSEQER